MTEAKTLTLADFLLARIAEDEARIRRADGDGEFRATWLVFRRRDGSLDYTTIASDHRNGYWCADGTTYQEDSRVTVREPFFDARRALAECEAKRRIIELHSLTEVGYSPTEIIKRGCSTCWSGDLYDEHADYPCDTLRALTLPYADHPDYRDEWRP